MKRHMKFKTVYQYDEVLIKQIARLHCSALSRHSFLAYFFGESFLCKFYRGILEDKLGFFVCANEGNRLIGFILGCPDSSKIMRVILRRFHIFFGTIVIKAARFPFLVKKLFQTIAYSDKSGSDVKPELLVIAVEEDRRSAGIGGRLLKLFEEELGKYNQSHYKVTVHKDMVAANKFYLKEGMRLYKTFDLYGMQWNVYAKMLDFRGKA